MKRNIIAALVIIFISIFSFLAGNLVSIHNLDIHCDHPDKKIYVTDFLNQEWVYDYNY